MTPINVKRSYYPALDGLRGAAILLVVFYHNFGFINYFFFGWLGVDLFFVLSGYLITNILLEAQEKKEGLYHFYIRRILRIFPLYYLSLFVFLILLPRFGHFQTTFQYYTDHQAWLWTYLQNWLYIFNPADGTHILHHFWSLAVEEQFYLIWPLVIFLIRKPRYLLLLAILVLATVLILRCVLWVYNFEDLQYFNLYTFSRIDGICIGCMIALMQKMNSRFLTTHMSIVVLLFAGLNFLFYFINRYYNFSFPYLALIGYSTFAMLFGLLIHEAVKQENKVINFIFCRPFLRFFGKISYGFYILHWPVYVILFPYATEWSRLILPASFSGDIQQIFSSIICTAAGIIISLVSYHFFESYFLKLKKRFS